MTIASTAKSNDHIPQGAARGARYARPIPDRTNPAALQLAAPDPDHAIGDSDAALVEVARRLRTLILDVAYHARVGHIASCLSVADIIAAALSDLDPDRDTLVLSKGHAALALYAGLHQSGRITRDQLFSYCQNDSRFGVHPDRHIPAIQFTTGSLGYGLGFAAGVALASRIRQTGRRCVALLSDAELNEGSTWEAIIFAGHHHLPITLVVDVNGSQALGKTHMVLDLEPLRPKLRSFGWLATELSGHDAPAVRRALRIAAMRPGPTALLARTVTGRGVSFMEGKVEWHYWPLTGEQYAAALSDVCGTSP